MRKKLTPFTAEMEIADAASDGRSVARHEGKVVFVEGGIPGDKAMVHVYRKQRKMLIGRVEELLESSQDRTIPECNHFGVCGGCKWQMMSYEAQLRYKEKQVTDAFERVGKVEVAERRAILGAPEAYFYRNKLEFTFSNKAWLTKEQVDSDEIFEQRVAGFHTARAFDKIIDIEFCHLQLPIVNEIRNEVRDFAREQNISFYNIREHHGFLRNIMFRSSISSQELMVVLIVGENDYDLIEKVFKHLEEKFDQITHFLWIHNDKANSSFSDLDFHVWKGSNYITEQLGEYKFQISPVSFFQTNPKQAERLYGVVRDYLLQTLPDPAAKHNVIYDLYTGTGSIGIFVSQWANKVVGIEYVQAAIDDAWKNLKLNHLDHFSFYAGDMKKVLTNELVEKEGKPSVIIADPPRAGMDPQVVQRILEIQPEHIIYVSCKPSTQARDIDLMQNDYEVLSIQPVDMFPQTAHVENVAFLRRKV